MAKLERRTQEAVHTLIRPYLWLFSGITVLIQCPLGQRLAAQKGESDDLVGAMKAQEKSQSNNDALSDEDD